MGAKLRCKLCNSIIQSTHRHDMVYCKCGKLGIDGGDDYARVMHTGNRDDYCMVDDQGNELIVKDDPKEVTLDAKPEPDLTGDEIYKQLMLAIDHQIDAMENLSQGGKFSPCTNQDLLAHLIWERALLSTLYQLLKKTHPGL